MEIINLSAMEINKKIREKELTSVEVVKAFLEKISGNKNGTFVTLNENALSEAEEIDEKIKNGEEVGKLAGIPIGIKDNISTYGIKTTCGSKMLEDYIPPFDATVIRKIKEEDGIIIGKINLDEFLVEKSPQESVDGVSLAVKNREIPLGIGSNLGRLSASCESIEIKPTYGLISRYGVISGANSMDQIQVCGNELEDISLLLSVLMDYDVKDSTSYEKSGEILEALDLKEDNLKGKTIGIIKETKENFNTNIECLKSKGINIKEVSLEHIKYAKECYEIISSVEFTSNMARYDGIRYGYRTEDYSDLDELYTDTRSEGFGIEVKKKIALGTYLSNEENRERYYIQALKLRRVIKEELEEMFKSVDFLLVLKTQEDIKNNDLDVLPSLAGLPAITIPMGKTKECPIGIQLIGPTHGDKELLEAIYSFEGGLRNGL